MLGREYKKHEANWLITGAQCKERLEHFLQSFLLLQFFIITCNKLLFFEIRA